MAIFTGRRLYTNNVQGTTTDNPLTDSATTMNSAGLANLAAVSGNHAVIVLDPLRAAGAPEIAIVTAHTGSATSATISRGAYGTSARQHAAGTVWVHAVTEADLVQILTANPSDNHEGQFWFRADTDILMGHNGTAAVEALPIGAWQSWTPTLTQGVSVNIDKTVPYGKFTRLGRLIIASTKVIANGAGTAGATITLSLPVTALALTTIPIGSGYYFDAGVGLYGAIPYMESTTTVGLLRADTVGAGNAIGVDPNIAVAGTDEFTVTVIYEAAS